jgi:hypothetical protein
MLSTNGYAVSVSYIDVDAWGEGRMKRKGVKRRKKKSTDDEFPNTLKMEKAERARLLDEKAIKLLFVDPGKDNIVSIGDGSRQETGKKKAHWVRYTNMQRRVESTSKRSRNELQEQLRRPIPRRFHDKHGNCTYRSLQETLIDTDSRSCLAAKFEGYLRQRDVVNGALVHFYCLKRFRRASYRAFWGVRSSEMRFWDHVLKTFSDGSRKLVLVWGDWGRCPNLRNNAPTPGIGFRRGCPFESVTQREAWTSSTCFCCSSRRMENFLSRPRVRKGRAVELGVHGLLRCPNAACEHRYWQRDVAGFMNIRKNAMHCLQHNSIHPSFEN